MMPQPYSGPKHASAEQLCDVVALSSRVFDADMGAEFPLLFDAERLDQLLIYDLDGVPVSLVGMTLDDTSLLGCPVRVACIGSVCTDPAHRGAGLAGRLMDAAVTQAVAGGAAIMLISGGRSLYTRRGAFPEGRFPGYDIPGPSLPAVDSSIVLEPVSDETVGSVCRLFESEPIRFRRDPLDYRRRVGCGVMVCSPAATYGVRRAGELVAALSVNLPAKSEGALVVREMAGSRAAILAALAHLVRLHPAASVTVETYASDYGMRDVCQLLGVSPRWESFPGTVKVLDVRRLWSDFAPLLAERIGAGNYEAIRVWAEADELRVHRLVFELGNETVEVDGDRSVVATLFGSVHSEPLAGMGGHLAGLLRQALPLPLPRYGLNFV
ncbi:MAG TPA: GNAT family N-acetyltransferase [Armatimonadota bacterium]|nr:GNAT family N-acetyltransferase [Armatimonadota bacterium]